MRTTQFVNGQFYHIFNRGTEKRVIFQDNADFRRFYESMYLFNDGNFSNPGGRSSLRDGVPSLRDDTRDPFVQVVSFCLLPNHFHMLLGPLKDGGITEFMYRLGMGYARYFNKRYERTGRLFEGTFKAVHVARDAQFLHLPRYIHLNALDLTHYNWREGKIQNWIAAEKFLDQYPWSSHPVYCGQNQQLPIVDRGVMAEIFPTPDAYRKFLREWSGRYVKSYADG
ncbi:transposase [Candidatus Uhrbacteria bacterium]|nr:transposase [Candidatus Uhrbacteria bacterium]